MKRHIPYLFILLLLPVYAKAQITVTADPSPFVITGTPSQTDIAAHIQVTNTSATSINLFWSKRMTNNPANWQSWICDKNLCYTPDIHFTPPSKPNVLAPGEYFDLQVHMNPAQTEGTGTYDLNLIDDQGNTIMTIPGQLIISIASSTKDQGDSKLTVYPNPTQDYFQVSETPGLRYVEIFNIVGNKMKSFDAAPQRQYYVSDLADGMYLVRLVSSTGKVLKTIRLSIR